MVAREQGEIVPQILSTAGARRVHGTDDNFGTVLRDLFGR